MRTYQAEWRSRILQVVADALSQMTEATVTLHRGQSHLAINRRNRNAQGEMVMAPNPDGMFNPDLWVFDVHSRNGKRCVLFNYACHPVIVYGYAFDAISADYPGECRRRLAEKLGAETQCQFIQGFAGNVRPRILGDLEKKQFRKPAPTDLQLAGAQLATDVVNALSVPGEKLELDLAVAEATFKVPCDLSRVPSLAHWQKLAAHDEEWNRILGRYWMEHIQSGKAFCAAVPWPIGLIRLTQNHTIAWLAGEPLAEWQSHLRCWLGNDRLITWGYCQEVVEYLPTEELLPEGGYEVLQARSFSKNGPAPFGPNINEAARQCALTLALQLQNKP